MEPEKKQEPMRRIPANQALEDIRAGMSDSDLMLKYQLTEKGLQTLFQKLANAGLLTRAQSAGHAFAYAEPPSPPSWKCPACGTTQADELHECPQCGIVVAKFKSTGPSRDVGIEPAVSQVRDDCEKPVVTSVISPRQGNIDMKPILGGLGCLFLFAGVFLPVMKLPFLGGVTLMQIGKVTGGVAGFAYFVLAITVISAVLIVFKYYRWLWLTSLGSAAVLFYTFLQFRRGLYQAKSWIGNLVGGAVGPQFLQNPQLRFFKDQMHQMLTLETDWGWAILFTGSALLAATALIATIRPLLVKPANPRSKSRTNGGARRN